MKTQHDDEAKKRLAELEGYQKKGDRLKALTGTSDGKFSGDKGFRGRLEYATDQLRSTGDTLPLFVIAQQDFEDAGDFRGLLGAAFYIVGTEQEPRVVNAFLVVKNGAHIDTTPTITEIEVVGNELKFKFAFTVRVDTGSGHELTVDGNMRLQLPNR
ncbi:hypothetical protein HU751_019605 [Pseudomonas sp. BW13M1]|uniref:Uncharacterized protein n=1 Tax=Pseudomonas peradeniyensis TaxID=2745488 RepID=A0A923G8J2_9PSED|nr:hypothetical protein [Pseudomonas peradeniyensis]MBV4507041.1 hypothetical protein [Pseudomonas peradeniyensis]